jgi:regulatory protein YycI of two-component signal transduction system YycFG
MERSRLKNIIILVLLLVNVFLLSSLAFRISQARSARARTQEELTKLLSSEGIELNADIPQALPPSGRTLSRNTGVEADIAAFFLGNGCAVYNEGGGIYTYLSGSEQAFFRANGSFDITGRLSEDGEAEQLFKKFCSTYGYRELTSGFTDDSGTATAVQYYENYPVANATVTFIERDGCLISVSGTYIPGVYSSETAVSSMNAVTALTKFLEACRESGAVVSGVSGVSLCYQLQSTTAASMTLIPVWCIETDTSDYYVNCSTGDVTHS